MTHSSATTKLQRLAVIAALGLSLGWAALAAPAARAAEITVDTTADDVTVNGNCTLREAIIAANTDTAVDACPKGNGADTVIIPAGTYSLTIAGTGEDAAQTGDLDITADLTLDGAGRANTTIDGAALDRVIEVLTGTVVIRQLTISGGDSGGTFGGGLRLDNGNLTVEAARVTSNSGNVGGIDIEHGTFALASSRVDNNAGATDGAIFLSAVKATIVNSEISDNTSTGDFSGISNAGTLTITNSTISGNQAHGSGGGLGNFHTASLYNVTVAGNTADVDSNGVGDGGGVFNGAGATLSAFNSILADNSGQLFDDCFSTDPIPASQFKFNLLEHTTGCTFTGSGSTNIFGQAPNLGPLAFNGGGLRTRALLAGSPAIDAGGPSQQCLDGNNNLLTTDQRGFARPVDGDADNVAVCDLGAFEYLSIGAPTPTSTASPTRTQTATATMTPTPDPRVLFIPILDVQGGS